jgi:LPXTG-site transpeptidase (sortase) family protein
VNLITISTILLSSVLGWIYIPSIDLARPIVEAPIVNGQYDMSKAVYSVAHMAQTDWVGGTSRIALGAHNPGIYDENGVYHSGSFDGIENIGEGDEIIIHSGNAKAKFVVYDIRVVHESEWQVLARTDIPMLTLIACYEQDLSYRIIVDAYLKEINWEK